VWTTLYRLPPRGGKRTIGGLGLKVLGSAVLFGLEAVCSLKKGSLRARSMTRAFCFFGVSACLFAYVSMFADLHMCLYMYV